MNRNVCTKNLWITSIAVGAALLLGSVGNVSAADERTVDQPAVAQVPPPAPPGQPSAPPVPPAVQAQAPVQPPASPQGWLAPPPPQFPEPGGPGQPQESVLRGFMLGAQVNQIFGTTGIDGGVRYWDRYVGGDLAFGFNMGSLSAGSGGYDEKIIDTRGFGFAFAGLLGAEIGRVKPHVRLGFVYSWEKDKVSDLKVTEFEIVPELAVDFLAAEHLMVGVTLLSFPFILTGSVSSGGDSLDVSGHSIDFLSGLRVAYVF